jgi:hypothetical protein
MKIPRSFDLVLNPLSSYPYLILISLSFHPLHSTSFCHLVYIQNLSFSLISTRIQ